MPLERSMRGKSIGTGEFPLGRFSAFERDRYYAEDCKATLKNVALCAKLAAVLVPLFSFLDYHVYPEQFYTFLLLRFGCVCCILAIWSISRQRFARKWYRLIATLIPLICAAFISLMIYTVNDPGTPYYAGLILCLVAIGALLHWTFKEAIVATGLVIGMYVAVCLPALLSGPPAQSVAYFINNCLFISAVGLIVILGSYTHLHLRYKEFHSRTRLRRNQIELGEKNNALHETLTTLKETERQLYQSEKMSFLGELSAGVIHEVGNPLNFTNQALFALKKRLSKLGVASETKEVVTDMQDGLDRMRGIVGDLREFSHSGGISGTAFPVSSAIESALRILNKLIEESDVEVMMNLDKDLQVNGIKNQIVQVFSNILLNAIQAMQQTGESGLLEITCAESNEGFVTIEIGDNGPGISEDDQKHLFDPFFTTKDPGEGTGLGLSISYRIMEAHGGTLQVSNRQTGGTSFVIQLPKLALASVQ